jgi:penicillin-binding protein 1A
MLSNGFITAEEAKTAKAEVLRVQTAATRPQVHAEYLAEMVRQLMYDQYGDETYTRGLDVVTTVNSAQQEAAYKALRRGIMDFERRQVYRGPEKFITLPSDAQELEDAIDEALDEHPDNGDVLAAVVLQADNKRVLAQRQAGEVVETANGVKILGIPNLPGRIATDASALYARNLFAFAGLLLNKEGALAPDLEDEILKAALVTQGGDIVNAALKG